MNSVQRSVLFSAVDRYAGLVLFFVSTAVLSRLLTPSEFGVYAVVNALTAVIAAAFQEFGGANYLIQKRELSRGTIRTAFTITWGISLAIALILLVTADVVSRLFAQDSLRRGIEVSALNLLVIPVSGTLIALFRRDMQFGTLAICNFASNVAVALVSIGLAVLNFSYMAPIWGGVAGSIVLAGMLLSWHRDFSVLRPSLSEYRDVIEFGLYSSGVSVINVFYNLAPQLFLAKILDLTAVGLYSRAINLTQVFDRLVTQVVNPIIMPAIVTKRAAGADLKGVYLDAVQLLSAVQWPFLTSVAIMAKPIVLIWLGGAWLEVVPLVRILCIANLALFAACLTYPVFLAVGRVRDALVSSFISLPPSLLALLSASFFGVEVVAACALLTLPFQAAVAIYYLSPHLALRPSEFGRALLKSGAVTMGTASGVAVCAVLIEAGALNFVAGLITALVVATFCWWCALILTGHPLLGHLRHAAAGLAEMAPRLLPSRPVL
ncbi:O-antigen/teichoic acid export membrane protein [Bradyrhizobium sp. CIR48]|uniref:oligosaccharide flippase family protein n=1 Tax=unclassified Bradyrhizobium TaxID=2631580 RepID=UPI00039C623D|nr:MULTISPECIES: oligosaccharide flippase family protein [unclassified Bradyrhizobium]MBB4425780.1 O-antigen/teichoic acid export membrane protein [Bradyrhizobium sp. CIR48]